MREPVRWSQDKFDEICEQLAHGQSLRAVCRQEGMPTAAAVIRWVNINHEGCAEQYARAREEGYALMADDILEISDTVVITERGDAVDRSRLRVDSRKWLLSKCLPKIYGDKQHVEGKFTVDWAQVCQEAADRWKKEEGG